MSLLPMEKAKELVHAVADPLHLRVIDNTDNRIIILQAFVRNKTIIDVKEIQPGDQQCAVAVSFNGITSNDEANARIQNALATLREGIDQGALYEVV